MNKILKKIYSVSINRSKVLFRTKFRRRILRREKIFWKKSDDIELINIKMNSSASIDEWKNMPNWQRRLENKLNAKEFAIKLGCRVAELYWNGYKKDFVELNLKSLPENFVVKPIMDHSSRNVYVMKKNKNLMDGKRFNTLEELKVEILRVYDSHPGIELLIEEFIPRESGSYEVANDYRLFMFKGHLAFIRLDERSRKEYDKVSFYTEDWNLITNKILNFASVNEASKVPEQLGEMMKMAKKLSEVYEIFVRLDFYDSPDGPVFGEFSPTPRGGHGFTSYGSKILIRYWDKYCKGML